jgi:hypothetical protein
MLAGAALGLSPEDVAAIAAGIQDGELLAGGNFMGGSASQIGPRPGGLGAITPDALQRLPNNEKAAKKYQDIREKIALPAFVQGV